MSKPFYAYLDSFDEITLIIPKNKYRVDSKFTLVGNNEIIDLVQKELIDLGSEEKIVATFDAYLDLENIYYVFEDNNEKSELLTGKVVRTPLFDSIYYYKKNDLGFTYTKEETKFKIWAPVAKKVIIELVSPNGEKTERNLFYKNQGVFSLKVEGDLEGYKYKYKVYVNGSYKETVDPYAISASANGEYAYIVDKTKFYKMEYPPKMLESPLDAVIYETSVQDFTNYFDNEYKSTYKLFTEEGLKNKEGHLSGFSYLKELGITHVQLMPINLFGGVDELDHFKKYNWGYNPVLYNTPSGLYSKNPNDPYERINELRKLIDDIHKAGLGVVIDVVYNHVYNPDKFPFEVLCPGYAYTYNREGIRNNYSGCSNDINSAKKMMRKFIMDSVNYWANEYKIDGFRFDLMGLLDFETVNDIYFELTNNNPSFLVYGEGWKMVSTNLSDSMAHMFNKNVYSRIGFFNDKFRNTIKDYALNKCDNLSLVKEVINASIIDRYLFKYSRQSINYTECHDNCTLFDYIRLNNKDISDTEAKKRALLAISITILSQGIPFIHSGMEFFRSKNFIDNTYKESDEINRIDWDKVSENEDSIEFIKKLLSIRKEYREFKLETSTDILSRSDISFTKLNTILYKLSLDDDLLIIFKTNEEKEEVDLSGYRVIVSNIIYDSFSIEGIGTMVLKKE